MRNSFSQSPWAQTLCGKVREKWVEKQKTRLKGKESTVRRKEELFLSFWRTPSHYVHRRYNEVISNVENKNKCKIKACPRDKPPKNLGDPLIFYVRNYLNEVAEEYNSGGGGHRATEKCGTVEKKNK
jgi:hypothetical protein